jgi:effector-binding domain-containing protein
MLRPVYIIALLTLSLASCDKKKDANETKSVIVIQKEVAPAKKEGNPERPPIINISDTIAIKYIVLYMKDSAASSDRISQKLTKIYGVKLPELIKKQQLKVTGPLIAWYKTTKEPFFFEAGIPINKKPAKLPKGVYVKTIGGEKAVVAHFFGPYSLTSMAYDALADYVKSQNKRKIGYPYEMYITDPNNKEGKVVDPYKVQTDIVYPYQ